MSKITTVKDYKVGFGTGADDINGEEMRFTDDAPTKVLPERRQNLKKLQRPRYEMRRREDLGFDPEEIEDEYEAFMMQQLLDKGDPFVNMVADMELAELDVDWDYLDDFVVAVFGRRRLGKTFGARNLVYKMKNRFPLVIVVTNTKLNGFWKKYVPEDFIWTVPDMDGVFEKLYARQTFILTHPELKIDPRVLLILDDVLEDQMILQYSKYLKASFTDGRHYKISILILLQYAKGKLVSIF
jgi:predicted acetyltransferase